MPFATSVFVIGGQDFDAKRVDHLDLVGFTPECRCAFRDTIGDDQIATFAPQFGHRVRHNVLGFSSEANYNRWPHCRFLCDFSKYIRILDQA